jgi:hypothetical protein
VRERAVRPSSSLTLLRVACHAVAWTAVLAPTVVQLERGWAPIGDDSFIASRAYQVFSRHSPLVGMYATGLRATGHRIYDLGPLESWLLAIPVRIAPSQGPLLGAAIVCGGALSLSIEALWRHRGWLPTIIVPLVMVDLFWRTNLVLQDIVWNAYFGLIFLIATICLSWIVACGRLRWWPALVFTASVAAQSHLMFALTSVALVVVSPLVGRSRGGVARSRWLLWGVVVGAAVWIAPVVQELTGSPGNMTEVLRYGRSLPSMGIGYGLRMLTISASPKPIMVTRFPSALYADFLFVIPHGSTFAGIAVLASLVAIALYARYRGTLDLAALAMVTFIVGTGTAFGFSSIAKSYQEGAGYLAFSLWVLGVLLWITWIWTAVVLVEQVLHLRTGVQRGQAGHARWPAPSGAFYLLAGLGLAGMVWLCASATSEPATVGTTAVSDVQKVAAAVEKRVAPPGPVTFGITPSGRVASLPQEEGGPSAFLDAVSNGIEYHLIVNGWETGLPRGVSQFFEEPGKGWPKVEVILNRGRVQSTRLGG